MCFRVCVFSNLCAPRLNLTHWRSCPQLLTSPSASKEACVMDARSLGLRRSFAGPLTKATVGRSRTQAQGAARAPRRPVISLARQPQAEGSLPGQRERPVQWSHRVNAELEGEVNSSSDWHSFDVGLALERGPDSPTTPMIRSRQERAAGSQIPSTGRPI